jgi:hypothetical protein
MTPTTELCPASDAPASVRAVEPQQPGSLSLYHLADDLVSLLALREEMAEDKESTEAADAAIAEYMQSLPQKVDGVVHVLRTLESQAELAAAEVVRLAARRRRIASAAYRLRQYCCDVLARLPKPKRGSRKLEGSTATLTLKGNGGLEPLDVYDEALVPDEYCTAEITVPFSFWGKVNDLCNEHGVRYKFSGRRSVDHIAIRKALAENCWLCEGNGGDCNACGGSGKQGVPGARLQERGNHLEIR